MAKGLDAFMSKADLTSVNETTEKETSKGKIEWANYALRIPKKWKDTIKNESMLSINAYIIEAVKKQMAEDGLL